MKPRHAVGVVTVLTTIAAFGAGTAAQAAPDAGISAMPTVVSITPKTGPYTGGTRVEIFGTGFSPGVTTATIGGKPCTNPEVAEVLYCDTPANVAGTYDVAVTVGSGAPVVLANAFTYTGSAVNPDQPKQEQVPVNCAVAPKRVKANGSTVVAARTCTTNAGQTVKVAVKATCSRGDLRCLVVSRKAGGKLVVRTFGNAKKLTVTRTAAATDTYNAYKSVKTYRLR